MSAWSRLKKNPAAMVSLVLLCLIFLMAIFAPLIARLSFEEQNMDAILKSPGGEFWFGTDSLGRDLFSRIVYGARVSMAVGLFTSTVALLIGGVYGAIAGWYGGITDSFLMRFVDILFSIPSLVLLILVKIVVDSWQFFENPQFNAVVGMFIALSLIGWVSLARMVRGQVLQLKELQFIEAARALGARDSRILIRHVLPNMLGPILVMLTFQIPSNILFESFLSFVGLGLQPPYSSWGVLANDGWRARSYPHLILFPGLFLAVSVMVFNLLGDGLRDAFDPKLKR